MMGEDIPIWERYLSGYPGVFQTVDYDFRVGNGMPLQEGWGENLNRMATMITQKRIDVLAWNEEVPTIIEVKKRAGLATVGQIQGYKVLFEMDLPNIEKPSLMVITEDVDQDTMMVFRKLNIPVVVV